MTRTMSSPTPFCLTAAMGTVRASVHLLVDDGDRHRRPVGSAQVRTPRSCPRTPATTTLRACWRRCWSGVVSSSVIVPDADVVAPEICTVQGWPTFSSVRLAAEACRVTVRSGSVSDRIGSPGVAGCAGLDEDLADAGRPWPDDHVGRFERHVCPQGLQHHGDLGLTGLAAGPPRPGARSPGRAAPCPAPRSSPRCSSPPAGWP